MQRSLHPQQPQSFAFTPQNLALCQTWIAKYPAGRQCSAVVPMLMIAQKQSDNWLSKAAMEVVGQMLSMPYIRVLEVATFYTMFNLAPVGKFFVQICGTTPCWLCGAEKLKDVCREFIGPEKGKVRSDGLFSWVEVECLGACVNAPMVQINDDTFEDLTPVTFKEILLKLEKGGIIGKDVKTGPQNGRFSSEPLGLLASSQ